MATATDTYLDYSRGKQWIQQVESMNDEVNSILMQVTRAIEDVKQQSQGAIVEQLVQSAQELKDKFDKMFEAIKKLVQSFVEAIATIGQFEDTVVGTLRDIAKAFLGGGLR